ncbi:MAG TPA: TrkH family potassium uptake protein [Bacteroidales bacterium]|nr:TrkH family potassium uptake protein [Bacteroidales bacterium]
MKLINPLIILRILSSILLIEAISYLSCIPVALIYKESPDPFLWSSVIVGLIYAVSRIISRKADSNKISNRDGYLAVTLSWIIFSLLGSLPYILSGSIPSFVDAFFESSSGFTTTGSSILPNVEILPFSILFWRSLTHWIGGLGIVVLVIIILPSLRITNYHLFSLESSLKEKIHPKTKAIGFRLLYIYLGLTLTEVILLSLGDMNIFESICHTFGTVATGGFSTNNLSIGAYSSYSQYIIMIFMFLAGISFVVYYYAVKLNFRKVRMNEELWFYLTTVIFAGATATFILIAKTTKPLEAAFRDGFFHIISIVTTTGYSNADYLKWPSTGVILIFLLCFTGASTGSTTGSIKMGRHLLVIKNIRSVFKKILHPNIVSQIKLNGKALAWNANVSILSFVIIYIFIFIAGTIVITIAGTDPVTSASAVASSLGNIGPGLGSIGPLNNYAHMPEFSKIFLSLLMIIGRLEIITVFVIFTRSFWKL